MATLLPSKFCVVLAASVSRFHGDDFSERTVIANGQPPDKCKYT